MKMSEWLRDNVAGALIVTAIVGMFTWTIGIVDEARAEFDRLSAQVIDLEYRTKQGKQFLEHLSDLTVTVNEHSAQIAVLSVRIDEAVNNNTKVMEKVITKLEELKIK